MGYVSDQYFYYFNIIHSGKKGILTGHVKDSEYGKKPLQENNLSYSSLIEKEKELVCSHLNQKEIFHDVYCNIIMLTEVWILNMLN